MDAKAKELKSLSRGDLLELLLAQTERVEQLEQELDEAKKKLDSRDILIDKSGTLAEAALSINRVWQAADQAAAQYLENVLRLYDEQMEKVKKLDQECVQKSEELLRHAKESTASLEQETAEKCRAMELESQAKCEAMERETRTKCETMEQEIALKCKVVEEETQKKLAATEQKCQEMENTTELACTELKKRAQEEAQAHWDTVHSKLEQYCASRGELSALLQMKG